MWRYIDMPALRADIERYVAMSSQERVSLGAKGCEWIVAKRSYQQLVQDFFKNSVGP